MIVVRPPYAHVKTGPQARFAAYFPHHARKTGMACRTMSTHTIPATAPIAAQKTLFHRLVIIALYAFPHTTVQFSFSTRKRNSSAIRCCSARYACSICPAIGMSVKVNSSRPINSPQTMG